MFKASQRRADSPAAPSDDVHSVADARDVAQMPTNQSSRLSSFIGPFRPSNWTWGTGQNRQQPENGGLREEEAHTFAPPAVSTPIPVRSSRSAFADNAAPDNFDYSSEYGIRTGMPPYRPPLPPQSVVPERPMSKPLPLPPLPSGHAYSRYPMAPEPSGRRDAIAPTVLQPNQAAQGAYIRPLSVPTPIPTTQPHGSYPRPPLTAAPAIPPRPTIPSQPPAYPMPHPVIPPAAPPAPLLTRPIPQTTRSVPDPMVEFRASIKELHSTLKGMTKLTSGNYAHWSAQVYGALEVRDVEHFVDGTLQWPDPRDVAAYEVCRKCDRLVSEVIERTVDESQIGYVTGQASAADRWRVLRDVHAPVSEARALQLRMKLDSTRLTEGGSMTAHLNSLRDTIRQLRELGHGIPEEAQRLIYLQSLPASYAGARETYLLTPRPLVEIIEGLRQLAETRTVEGTHGTGSSGERAFASQGARAGAVCWDCCAPGHSAGATCPSYLLRVKTFGTGSVERLAKRYAALEDPQSVSNSRQGNQNRRQRGGRRAQANAAETNVDSSSTPTDSTTPSPVSNPSLPPTSQAPLAQAQFAAAADWQVQALTATPTDLALSTEDTDNADIFYIDSGCSSHMTYHRTWFTSLRMLNSPISVSGIGNTSVYATGVGDAVVPTVAPEGMIWTRLRNCLYVPDLRKNLMSYSKFLEDGMRVDLRVDGQMSRVVDRDGQLVASSFHRGGVWPVTIAKSPVTAFLGTGSARLTEAELWHRRLGHLGSENLSKLATHTLVHGLPKSLTRFSECDDCALGKGARLPFDESESHSSVPFGLVHSDLAGPFPTSVGGSRYWITFVDDHSRYLWVRSMRSKSDAFGVFKDWHKAVTTQTGRSLLVLRTDNGGEYVSDEWARYLADHGIAHQTSTPYTPQQNGRAERVNRTLKERVRCILSDSGLAKGWWAEIVQTAAYIINRSPHSALRGMVPFEAWTGLKPSVAHMRVPGTKCFAVTTSGNLKALEPRAVECRFLGYDQEAKAYRLLKAGSTSVIRSRDVIFHEHTSCADSCSTSTTYHEFESTNEPSPPTVLLPNDKPPSDDSSNDDTEPDVDQSVCVEPDWEDKVSNLPTEVESNLPRRSGRLRRPSRKIREMANIAELPAVPSTYRQMQRHPDRIKWEEGTIEEFQSWREKGVYEVVRLPRGHRRLGTKPVYVLKTNAQGEIERWKVRYVALGNLQRPGYEFNETSSPTARPETLRLMCSLAASNDWELHQMDVKTAFLHGDIDCEIHLSIPDGFPIAELPDGVPREDLALRLNKAVYGLKQAGHVWFVHCVGVLVKLGFTQAECDPCLFYVDIDGVRVWVLVYVDDFTILTRDTQIMAKTKKLLSSGFDLKDLGEARQILGLEIQRDRVSGLLRVLQRKYVRSLLAELGMESCLPAYSPMEAGLQLKNHGSGKPEDELDDEERAYMLDKPYARVLGSLNWMSTGSRPDISFALSFLAQHSKNPGPAHWKALMRVVAYLRTTIDSGLTFTRGASTCLLGYSDSDHAGDTRDYISYTGYIFILGGGAIAWRSSKQKSVAKSSAEAEFMALSETAASGIWLRKLCGEFKLVMTSTTIRMDSQSAMKMALRESLGARTKHIAVNFHYARNLVRDGTLALEWVPGAENVADVCTKALPRATFQGLLEKLAFVVYFDKSTTL